MSLQNSLDQNQDYSGKELYSYFTGIDLPSFVKEAELADVTTDRNDSTIAKTAFADPVHRHFPIDSKLKTYVSNAFVVNKEAELNKIYGAGYTAVVKANIQKAAEVFEITEDLKNYENGLTQKLASELPDTFSIGANISHLSDEPFELELFHLKSAYEVAEEADNFNRNIEKFPFQWRSAIANDFVKAAEYFQVEELPDMLLKYAGQYYPDADKVRTELFRRAGRLPEDHEHRATYAKLAEDVVNFDSTEDFLKLAETCYLVEKTAGLYDSRKVKVALGDPVDKFFTVPFTKVAEELNVVKVHNEYFSVADLEKVSTDIYEQAFGFEKPASAQEMRDVLPTMPLSDVALFKKLSGVSAKYKN